MQPIRLPPPSILSHHRHHRWGDRRLMLVRVLMHHLALVLRAAPERRLPLCAEEGVAGGALQHDEASVHVGSVLDGGLVVLVLEAGLT